VAHAANPMLVGASLKGKGNVSGKMFRDEIVEGALENGTGWEEYIYINPSKREGRGLRRKSLPEKCLA